MFRPLAFAVPFLVALASTHSAHSGDFTVNLGTNPNWPANGTGPVNFTMTDQYGFELDATGQIVRFGGSALSPYPNEVGFFGVETSLGLVWDAGSGTSGIGESTNTATLSFSSGGSPFAPDSISFVVSDIDSVDNNSTTDRCDFVTFTGDNGNPALSYLSTNPATRSVIIGPGSGSGSTGTIAANQAQCVYNLGATGSPNSAGDINGSVLATWPAGTTSTVIAYDESIENVLGVTSANAAARGIGIWASSVIVVNQSISLAKTPDVTFYSSPGDVITYTYTITNNGPLPINTGQNIQINDDQIGTFTCGTISTPIPSGGTHSCTNTYTISGPDIGAGSVTNNAVAGVGTGSQAFASRLQSNTATVTVVRGSPSRSFTITKTVDQTNIDTTTTLNFTISVANTGNVSLTNPVLTDILQQGTATRTLTSGPTLVAASDTDGDGDVDAGETWQYVATYNVPQSNINNGNDLVNTATFSADLVTSASDSSTTTITQNPELTLTKVSDVPSVGTPGDVINYTITLENTGNIRIRNITVSDPLLASISCTPGSGANPNNMNPGTIRTCTGSYTLTQTDLDNEGGGDGDIDNTATVDADYAGPLPPFTQDVSHAVTINLNPSLTVTKSADDTTNVTVGQSLTYTYVVVNNGNQTLSNITLADIHGGSGPPPVPGGETLTNDTTPAGDSSDGATNGVWDTLAPGDEITFTATYNVTQNDVDTLQ